MAYHYAVNTQTGERKRIRTESLPTYQGSRYWQVYDTEEEANAIPDWHVLCYSTGSINRYTAFDVRSIWTEAYLKAGYGCFHTLEAARAAWAAYKPQWVAKPFTGDIYQVQAWLPEEQRPPLPAGYGETVYSSRTEALAACPIWHCIGTEGEARTCFESKVAYMKESGWFVARTLEEARAMLPLRWIWSRDTARYVRATRGNVLRRSSFLARFRSALRAASAGSDYCEAGAHSYMVREVLNGVVSNLTLRLDTIWGTRDYAGYETELRKAHERMAALVNRVVGREYMRTCPDCNHGSILYPEIARTNPEGVAICRGCAVNYTYCMTCSCVLSHEDAMEDSRGNVYCAEHWTQPDNGPRGALLDYSTDVTRRKRCFQTASGEKKTARTLWLGWELEVHAQGGKISSSECCEDCNDSEDGCCNDECECHEPKTDMKAAICHIQDTASGWAIAKSDSSLENSGLEIVSVPASLAWHAQTVKPWLGTVGGLMSAWPHDDCGMHVHVGIAQLSKLTQGKLVTFMHAEETQNFLNKLAGRDAGSYCIRGKFKKSLPDYAREAGRGRYQALNFSTRGKKTIEFRIFRSNVAPAGFMKNLEFVHALCSWARLASMQEVCPAQEGIKGARRDNPVSAFVAYVKRNRSQYPHLMKWFEAYGYLPKPRVHPDAPVSAMSLAA